jgi:hypothetical protein
MIFIMCMLFIWIFASLFEGSFTVGAALAGFFTVIEVSIFYAVFRLFARIFRRRTPPPVATPPAPAVVTPVVVTTPPVATPPAPAVVTPPAAALPPPAATPPPAAPTPPPTATP